MPGLTTVRQNFDAVGRQGLERLLTLIEGKPARRRVSLIEPTLGVKRGSTARQGRTRRHGRRGRPSASR